MRLVILVSVAFFSCLIAASATFAADYDEAVDGEIVFESGMPPSLRLELDPGVNTVTGILDVNGGSDADSDYFHFVVPEGSEVVSIHYDYSTVFINNSGSSAFYNFYFDKAGNGLTFESVRIADTPSDSRDMYAEFLPSGSGQYSLGRAGSAIGDDMIYDVHYTWTIVVDGVPEVPIELEVPASGYISGQGSVSAPLVDGRFSYGEWSRYTQLDIDNGFIRFMHDRERLYVLIDMLDDSGNDALAAGGGDQLWLYFDVDEDGVITPDVDLRYRLESGTGNLRYQTFCESCLFGYNNLEARTYSSRGEGFGCYIGDGSAKVFPPPLKCDSHRIWELAIDLGEIGMRDDKTARFGYLIASGMPLLSENYPEDVEDMAGYGLLTLLGDTRATATSGPGFVAPDFEITQAIQTPQNDLDLVAGKPTAVRIWAESNTSAFRGFVYASQGGIDLPGSPLLRVGSVFDDFYDDPRDTIVFNIFMPFPAAWTAGGEVAFDAVLQGLDDSQAATLHADIDFLPTQKPVFWTVPIRNILPDGGLTTIEEFWIDNSEAATQRLSPIREIEFVRRPEFRVNYGVSSAAMKASLREYDQFTRLVWLLGVVGSGQEPFALPDQITGFNRKSLPSGGKIAGGSSDPIWANGEARISWIAPQENVGGNYGYVHELNHNLDMRSAANATWGLHSRGCNVSDDTGWPYGSSFTIQEVGVSWGGMQFNSVSSNRPDYMSYCSAGGNPPVWISPYRWQAWLDLFRSDNPAFAASVTAVDVRVNGVMVDAVDSYYVQGRAYPDATGEFGQVLQQLGLPTGIGEGGDHTIELRDCSDAMIAQHSFAPSFYDVDGDLDEFASFNFVLPASPMACSIVLTREGEVLATRTISANAPLVTLIAPNGDEVWDGNATVTWTSSDVDEDELRFSLLYSTDGGLTWEPIATHLDGSEYTVNSDDLPGSDNALIRILATDGANTSEDDSDASFSVVHKAPRLAITTPPDGGTFDVDQPLTLSGVARDSFGNALPTENLLWSIDGESIGMGADLQAQLDVGVHEVLLEYLEEGIATTSAMSEITLVRAGIELCGHASGSTADAAITATDALVTLNAAVGLTACEMCRCDVDGSGSVVASDALIILNLAVGLDRQRECQPCTDPPVN